LDYINFPSLKSKNSNYRREITKPKRLVDGWCVTDGQRWSAYNERLMHLAENRELEREREREREMCGDKAHNERLRNGG